MEGDRGGRQQAILHKLHELSVNDMFAVFARLYCFCNNKSVNLRSDILYRYILYYYIIIYYIILYIGTRGCSFVMLTQIQSMRKMGAGSYLLIGLKV